ncbi:MAG: Crp/Fnr family transcriptional regulator [Hyphomicrobiales bacterium]|nr:MAG: Crp/Fnr family transcriptional regulator [Hyphomicrobiales bacterium]
MPNLDTNKFDSALFLALIGNGGVERNIAGGTIVYSQGDPANSVYFIRKGTVRIATVSSHGKEAVVAVLGPGDFFGEGCLAGQDVRIGTAIAVVDSDIIQVAMSAILGVLKENHAVAGIFTTHLLARNVRMESDLIDQLFNSSEKRLARLLLLLANFGKEGMPQPIVSEISQETLAEMIGTSRARVERFMGKFRRLGFISGSGPIEVHSSLLSVVLRDNMHSIAIAAEDDAQLSEQ